MRSILKMIICALLFCKAAIAQPSDSTMIERIKTADASYSLKRLSDIVDECVHQYAQSVNVANEISIWLNENHSIYTGKSASEVSRLRGYLIAALSNFKPGEQLYAHVKYELQFAEHVFNVAAAAHAAKQFPGKAGELVKLLKRYLQPAFRDEYVDFTTIELNYPLLHPTRAQYEVIKTLQSFREASYSCISLLDVLISNEKNKTTYRDTILLALARTAANEIEESTPVCCRKQDTDATSKNNVQIIPANKRTAVPAGKMQLLDQEGRQINFSQMKGKPFVLTFFYTSCSNAMKCAATIDKLAKVQQLLTNEKQDGSAGLYAMTYDAETDKPAVLKTYGELYGMKFTRNAKFLLPLDNSQQQFTHELNLRVNYGFGSVNQHGIQLFIFDRKGRLAAVYDNEAWEVREVYGGLVRLMRE